MKIDIRKEIAHLESDEHNKIDWKEKIAKTS